MILRSTLGLLALVMLAVLLQLAVFPAFVPALLRPDVGLLLGMAALAFGTRDFGLVCLFALGLQADLFGSARFGLLTFCSLAAARLILWAGWRELTRGDLLAAWVGGLAGTFLTHLFYILLGRMCGLEVPVGQAVMLLLSLLLGAVIWGLPCAWLCGGLLNFLNLFSPAVRERWAAAQRQAAARRGKTARA